MMSFKFDGRGVPKQSTRFANGHCHPQKNVTARTKYIQASARVQMDKNNWCKYDCPVEMHIITFYRLPKSANSWQKGIVKNGGAVACPFIADTDNLAKLIGDALKDIAFGDDRLVVRVISEKWYYQEACQLVSIDDADLDDEYDIGEITKGLGFYPTHDGLKYAAPGTWFANWGPLNNETMQHGGNQ